MSQEKNYGISIESIETSFYGAECYWSGGSENLWADDERCGP